MSIWRGKLRGLPRFAEGNLGMSGTASWPPFQQLVQVRDLLRELIARDIKLRYRGSLLGIAWTLLNPLAELLVLLFVFSSVFRVNIPNFGAYLFTGLLVYGWFQTSLNFADRCHRGQPRTGQAARCSLGDLADRHRCQQSRALCPVAPHPLRIADLSGVHITSAVFALPILIAIQFIFIAGLAYPVADDPRLVS